MEGHVARRQFLKTAGATSLAGAGVELGIEPR